jgi:hypothetical protein
VRDPVKAKEKAPACAATQTGAAFGDSVGGRANTSQKTPVRVLCNRKGRKVQAGRAWAC